MTPRPVKYPFSRIQLLLIAALTAVLLVARADPLEQDRKQYQQIRDAQSAGKITSLRQIPASLEDYPLYPYLIYSQLRPRLAGARDEEIVDFLSRYPDLPVTDELRRTWLKLLARQGRWGTYLEHYATQQDTEMRCFQLQARIKSGADDREKLLEDILRLWLVGKSQPQQCDPVFEFLYQSDFLSPEMVWERIRLSMHNHQTSLAAYLGRRLPDAERKWLDRWLETYRNPGRGTHNPGYEDVPIARDILAHALQRLARADIPVAISRWEALSGKYAFDDQQRADILCSLATWAVIRKHPRAGELLEITSGSLTDGEMFHWRLRDALEQRDWPRIVRWTEGAPPDEDVRLRWLYWRARALEQTGEAKAAADIYRKLADERDYYGFMAADRIAAPYNMAHAALPEDQETWQSILETGGMQRAREFFLTGDYYMARREWHHALRNMDEYQLQIAAAIAANWGWHDRAILALGQARAYDDLVLRFPLVFQEEITRYSGMHKLDTGWAFALTRAESAFMADARSPAGALGLMQVMPATGQETARRIKLEDFRSGQLLQPEKNITIGTAYLKQVYDRFDNMVLATAAYNAGPAAVSGWLPKDECLEPDIWVEKIPYSETRKYVSRILFYATVYDWRMNNEVTRINQRMSIIHPKQDRLVADLSCPATQNVSQS